MLNAPNGNIIISSLRNRHVLLYNTSARTLMEIDMPFQPSAINISDREEIIIINNTNFARLDMNGNVIYQTEIPIGFLNNIQSVNHIGNKLYIESNGFNVEHKIKIWDFIENPYIFLELNNNQNSLLFYKISESQFLLAGEFIYQLQDGSFTEINQNDQLSNGIDLATQHNNYGLLLGDSKVFILNEKGNLLSEVNHQANFNQDIAVIGDSIYLFSNRIIEKIKIPYASIYHQDQINICDTIPLLNNNYSYQFSNGENDFDFVNQAAGKYWATITDDLGCMNIDTFFINDQLEITTSAINVPIGNRTDGFIQISVDNGVPPYTYTWSNGENTARIENLTQGTYTVTVTDAAACETIKAIALNRIRIINDDVVDPGDIIIFPNPSPGPIIIFPLQQNIKQLSIFNMMGKKVMEVNNLNFEKLELNLSHLNKGIYFVNAEIEGKVIVKKIILQ